MKILQTIIKALFITFGIGMFCSGNGFGNYMVSGSFVGLMILIPISLVLIYIKGKDTHEFVKIAPRVRADAEWKVYWTVTWKKAKKWGIHYVYLIHAVICLYVYYKACQIQPIERTGGLLLLLCGSALISDLLLFAICGSLISGIINNNTGNIYRERSPYWFYIHTGIAIIIYLFIASLPLLMIFGPILSRIWRGQP